MIKSDQWIREMAEKHEMIKPFAPAQVRQGNISYGVSSYGYDMRISQEFTRIKEGLHGLLSPSSNPLPHGERASNNEKFILDPKNIDAGLFEKITAKEFILRPNSFVLARSVEYFKIPRSIITVCYGKSTYARCGIVVNVTPFEPQWEGYATISISNTAGIPVKLYANEGIAQLLFFESVEQCSVSYADKNGKYQAQRDITHSKV